MLLVSHDRPGGCEAGAGAAQEFQEAVQEARARRAMAGGRAGAWAEARSAWSITSQAAVAVGRPVASRIEPRKALQLGYKEAIRAAASEFKEMASQALGTTLA